MTNSIRHLCKNEQLMSSFPANADMIYKAMKNIWCYKKAGIYFNKNIRKLFLH